MINSTMRQWADDHIEDYLRDQLGEPNTRLSTRKTLRWGSQGSFKLELSGAMRGFFYDRDPGCAGKPSGNSIACFAYFEDLDDEGVEAYIRDRMAPDYQFDPAKRQAQQKKAKAERDAERAEKLKRAQDIIRETIPLAGTAGERYWKESRQVSRVAACLAWRPNAFGKYGAFVIIATDRNGDATGGQQIYVDDHGRKAPVAVVKRSFGTVKGSAGIMPCRPDDAILPPDWEILAEGPETSGTAWDVAGNRTLSCLGSNFADAPVTPGAKLMIMRDGDRLDAPIHATIAKEIADLVAKGHVVVEAWPDRHYLKYKKTDFNDIARNEPDGAEIIRQIILDAAAPHMKAVAPHYPDKSIPAEKAKAIMATATMAFLDRALAFKNGTGPAVVEGIKGSAGGGKSEMLVEHIADESMADNRIAFAAPSHKLLNELAAKYEGKQTLHGLPIIVLRGRGQTAPCGTPVCRKAKEAEEYAKLGGNVWSGMCSNGVEFCEHFAGCIFANNVRRVRSGPCFALMPHSYLFIDGLGGKVEPFDALIIDEKVWPAAMHGHDKTVWFV